MDLTDEQRKKLAAMGLPPEQVERFHLGQEVAFDFRTESAAGVALLQILAGLLRCGILEINDPGGGLLTFVRFRNNAYDLARSFGIKCVEIYGMAVINPELRELLIRQSFIPRNVPCPDDLGGGSETVEILAKTFVLP